MQLELWEAKGEHCSLVEPAAATAAAAAAAVAAGEAAT